MNPMKRSLSICLFVLFLLVCGWFGFQWFHFLGSPLVSYDKQPVNILLSPGSSVKKLAYSLKQQKLLEHPLFFVLFVRFSGVEHALKAGEYVVDPGVTPRQLVQKMVKGEALRHALTVVEGWTFAQIIAALNSNPYIKHTIQNLTVAEIMEKIGHFGEAPEGRFAPDTFLFSGDMTDVDLLLSSYQLMQKRLKTAWDSRDLNVPYHCPYEALIVASLIEKETAIAQEKPLIAGVILKRLNKGMALQVDPTVIYGLGDKLIGKLKKSDLQIDTQYNTYTRRGLPPTPISMPGIESIEAALHPIASTYWYYVAKGDGTHKFSDSLENQSEAIKKYIKDKKKTKDKSCQEKIQQVKKVKKTK